MPRPVSRCEVESRGLGGFYSKLAAPQGREEAQAEIKGCTGMKQLKYRCRPGNGARGQ